MQKFKKVIPRRLRENLGKVKEYILYIFHSDASKKKAYKSYFEKTGTIFIHIPKCAGTSVALSLYGVDPWHFSVKSFSKRQLKKNKVFAVVRDPVERLASSYKYLCEKADLYPNTFYSDVKNCENFETFVERFVFGKKDEDRNYFLRSQYWYLTVNENIMVDYIIKINELDDKFPNEIKKRCNYKGGFPQENKSKTKNFYIEKKLVEKIKSAYKLDYEYIINNDYKN